MNIKFISTLALLCFFSISFAQKPFEGKISYKIDYPSMPEDMKQMESMLPKETLVYAKGAKSRTETGSLMGTQVVISDSKRDYGVVLMDMLGNKMAIEPTEEELSQAKIKNDKLQIKYSSDTKSIAGLKCKKATITSPGEEFPLEVWYTEEYSNYNTSEMKQLKGMPLEYSVRANGLEMRMMAQSVTTEKVDDSKFEVPADYKKMTSADMQKMFGQ